MKKKTVLSAAFLISLLPILLNQYGGMKGVQEIAGMINLLNPIGIVSAAVYAAGVWAPFRNARINMALGAWGTVGMVVSEIYQFFTWHVMTVTGEVSLQHSIRLAFPEFYVGLAVSVGMVAAYFMIHRLTEPAEAVTG